MSATRMRAAWDTYTWLEAQREEGEPLIVTCALNGGVQGRESHPALPESPEEIAAQAKEAYDAGASIVHIHGRGPTDMAAATTEPDVYREINAAVRAACPDVIINNTTGGGVNLTMEDRYALLAAAPEMASLNLGPDMSRFRVPARSEEHGSPHPSYVHDACVPYSYGVINNLAKAMGEHGVKPEMELYHSGQFWVVRDLLNAGLLGSPYVHQFVMGYQTSAFATPDQLVGLIQLLPEGSVYFVCGVGHHQLPMTTLAMVCGGHVRVGLEDNLYYSKGRKFRGNGEPVERAVRIATELNRDIATPLQARARLGLDSRPRAYSV